VLLPQTLDALYPYQREGVEWLRPRRSGLIADEPGLGKSLQVIVNFANLRTVRPDARVLLTAPNNVIYKWAEVEWGKWSTFSVEVATGTAQQRKKAIESGSDVTIVAYDNLNRNLADFNKQGYYQLLFDESHNIKNRSALRTKAAFALRGAQRFLITGSPLLNRVDELWSQLFMIDPIVFGNYWGFVNRYAVFGGYEGRQIIGVQNARELRGKIAPYMLRRLVKDVGKQIPPRTNIPVFVDLLPEQRKAYDIAKNELKIEFEGQVVHEFSNPLTAFMRLRQISNTLASVGGPDVSAKLDRAVELVQQIGPDHKVVIFSGDITSLHCLRERLERIGINAPIIAGTVDGKRMDASKREPVIQAFQTQRDPRVLLASYGVAREGIDLYAASYGITLDRMWVPDLQDQAYRRLQRTGQTADHVIFYDLTANKTVEQRVEKILAAKQQTVDTVIKESDLKTSLVAQAMKDGLAFFDG
jgi:SNF2 family DNA or RNA helicase